MRNLGDWEGKMVRIEGFIQKTFIDNREEGLRTFLLEPVKIRTFNDNDNERVIDHLWVYDKTSEELKMQIREIQLDAGIRFMTEEYQSNRFYRLDKLMLIGKVHRYTRSDGSVDYGVERYVSLDLEAAITHIQHYDKLHRYNVCLGICNNLIKVSNKQYMFVPLNESIEKLTKKFYSLQKKYTLLLEAERKANEKGWRKTQNIRKRRVEWISLNKSVNNTEQTA